ncbi:DinB family protein [bacterium]|nr:DinB family protein [bacterium]
MYRKVEDFIKAYGHEAENTLKYFKALTDESLKQKVAEGHWSLGRLAWHITTTIPEMMSQTGLTVSSVDHEAPKPEKAEEIVTAYEKVSKELLDVIKEKWDDATLEIEDNLYGENWKRGLTLAILVNHEIHHRAQMSVLMRQAGLKVPGIYGPAKEEWAAFGAEAPAD